ncbi:MAG: GAF domain-containing protein, partial [Planctomycetota bacterium]|nr:GAF domain-containing protein [Planctomycetota bacterium]
MTSAPMPPDESLRIDALRRANILDTEPEREFDDLVQIAAHVCSTPIAVVSLIDVDRQWFKAKVGIDATETSREVSFCAHAILGDEVLVVPDATRDSRFAHNPLVTADPHIRFYAGAPMLSPDGHPLGSLCVIDMVPHEITPEQEHALAALARLAR